MGKYYGKPSDVNEKQNKVTAVMKHNKQPNPLMWLLSVIAEYVYPPICISCGNESPADSRRKGSSGGHYIMKADPESVLRECFCAACLSDFEADRAALCEKCGKSISDCECAGEILYQCGIKKAFACFKYDKSRHNAASSRLIYTLKSAENLDAVSYSSGLLASRIKRAAANIGFELSSSVLAYAPRRSSAIINAGADHMRLVGKKTADLLGIGFADIFINGADGAQKKKTAAQRIESAFSSIELKTDTDACAGKNFIVIDDVITSGATLAACSQLLKLNGACNIMIAALAKASEQ